MKKKHIFSGAAIVALSMFAASCTNEDTATSSETNNGQLTEFVGTMASDEEPVTRAQVNSIYDTPINTVNGLDVTRVSMNRTDTKSPGEFSWETTDYVFVQDDNQEWKKSSNATQGKSSNFKLEGTYSGSSYTVLYKGTDTNANNSVTIPATQTQSAFGNTEHLKASGDCAVGTTTKNGNNYSFTLQHKVAYLCFLPYSDNVDVRNQKITKVEVVSSANLAGTYTLTTGNLNGTGSSKTVSLNVTDGTLANCTAADVKNALYMVVAPGTGYFRIDVTLSDGTFISKTYASMELKANTVYNFPLNLDPAKSTTKIFDYTNDQHYTWSTANSQGRTANLPNANEMAWYVEKGGAMYDDNTLWTPQSYLNSGKPLSGGIWLKTRSKIAADNNITEAEMKLKAPDGSTDYQEFTVTTANGYNIKQGYGFTKGKPTAEQLKDYFFLPASTLCTISGSTQSQDPVGRVGYYWSSTQAKNNITSDKPGKNPCYVLFFDVQSDVIKLKADGKDQYKMPANASFFK